MRTECTGSVIIVSKARNKDFSLLELNFFPNSHSLVQQVSRNSSESDIVHLTILQLVFIEYSNSFRGHLWQ